MLSRLSIGARREVKRLHLQSKQRFGRVNHRKAHSQSEARPLFSSSSANIFGLVIGGVMASYVFYKWYDRNGNAFVASAEESTTNSDFLRQQIHRQNLLKRSSNFLIQTKEEIGCPGIAVAVFKEGEMVYEGAVGWSDVENLIPMTPDSVLRVASISKSFTSAALGILVDSGKLDLDKPIAEYLPVSWWPTKTLPDGTPAVITSRQLASHHAGVRTYKGNEFEGIRDPVATVEQALQIFRDDPLEHPPGTKYLYSTHAYTLLAAVIEAVSGENYLDFMENHIVKPLGLIDMRPDYNDEIIPGRAHFYVRTPRPPPVMGQLPETPKINSDDPKYAKKHTTKQLKQDQPGILKPCLSVDNSWKWAGGGWLSTARDVAQFGNAMLFDRLVSSNTKADLWTPINQGKYGVGWSVKTEPGLHGKMTKVVSHSGGAVGSSSQIVIYPDEKIVVAVLGNLQDVRFYSTAATLAHIWRDSSSTAHSKL